MSYRLTTKDNLIATTLIVAALLFAVSITLGSIVIRIAVAL